MKIDKSLMSGSTTLLVLSLLSREEMYGYQMITELARRSDHTFELKEGTLYPVLHQLEREGCLESYSAQAPSGRARKYYRLTSRGRKALADQEAAFRRVAGAVEQVLRRSCPEA